tara:strand:- start:112 stop:360 length:249 start_codon:yes stop_codon:yes gene_type:complete
MARPIIKFDKKNCAECGVLMPPVTFKRPYAKLCPDCKSDMRAGNHELRQIFQDLRKQPQETEDWESQNVKTNDDAMHRNHRF